MWVAFDMRFVSSAFVFLLYFTGFVAASFSCPPLTAGPSLQVDTYLYLLTPDLYEPPLLHHSDHSLVGSLVLFVSIKENFFIQGVFFLILVHICLLII